MYSALLKFKDGKEKSMFIERDSKYIYYDLNPFLAQNVHEYIELTPNNIINEGGFSDIELPKNTKVTLYLINRCKTDTTDQLTYKEI